jgi:hypothetical protein
MRSLRLTPWTAAAVVAACTFIAYLNSLGGRFVMDDRCEIADNPAIRSLADPWRAMFVGHYMPARPLPYLTFAIDYSLWGPEPFGYHITNLVIHTIAALAVFWLARTTLAAPRFRGACADHATPLAACIATLWAVHPLCTQAVTYVYQRIESLTGMFCLLALAAFAQAAARRWDRRWLAGCVLASAGAMASKENAVVLPLLILGYDWLVVGAGADGLRQRRWFYAALFATWGILGLHLVGQLGRYQEFQDASHPPLAYALTQPRVILHYLRLALWPVGLCFDLPWPISKTWREIVPSLLYVLAILAGVAVGVVRGRAWSWLGVVFFLALAPTSSILPVAAPAAEHRMYLPLAALVAAVVLAAYGAVCRMLPAGRGRDRGLQVAALAAAVTAAVLILLTQARNDVYAVPGGVWMDVLRRQPRNERAIWNLAVACEEIGEFDAALRYADQAAELNVRLPVYEDMASIRMEAGDDAAAERALRHAVEKRAALAGPDADVTLATTCNLVILLNQQRRFVEAEQEAAAAFDRVVAGLPADDPRRISVEIIHANGLHRAGRDAEAEAIARAAVESSRAEKAKDGFQSVAATVCLGTILHDLGRHAEAETVARAGLADVARRLAASSVDVAPLEGLLATVLESTGRSAEAAALRRQTAARPQRVQADRPTMFLPP